MKEEDDNRKENQRKGRIKERKEKQRGKEKMTK